MEQLTNRHFVARDFSGENLKGRDLSHSIFDRCIFDKADMTGANASFSDFRCSSFRGTNCYLMNAMGSVFPATDFDPSECYGMTVTMTCKTFENAHLGQLWFYLFLMFAASTRPVAHPVKENLRDLLIAFIGNDRYLKLRDMMQRRNY